MDEIIHTKDGVKLYCRTWKPEGIPVRATVTAIHGLGEHISRYDHVFSVWALSGILTSGIDLRGFGKTLKNSESKMQAGNIGNSLDDAIPDIHLVTEKIRIPNLPHFVFGQSMGGLLAILYANVHADEITGVISSCAAIDSLKPSVLIAAGPYLSYVAGSLIMDNGLNCDFISSSKEVVQNYLNDPFTHRYITVRLGNSIFQSGIKVLKYGKTWKTPILLTHGKNDRITGFNGTKQFYENITVEDKTLKSFDKAFHELHNEPDIKNEVIGLWLKWILDHSK